MKNILIFAALGFGAWYLYNNYVTATTGLPPGSSLAQSFSLLGQTFNVYVAASGYYIQAVSATGMILNTYGPYSQAQVADALALQNTLTSITGAL